MYFVYALHSSKFKKIFIGCTRNMDGLVYGHNNVPTKSYTYKYRPWSLVYSEEAVDKSAALARQKELESSKGREFILSLIAK